MKTFLLIALTFTGIALCSPDAQARDHRHSRNHDSYRNGHRSHGHNYYRGGHRSHGHSYYRSGYRSHGHSYYRGHYPRHGYYSSSYYRPASHYYYRPSRSYYSSDRCYSERRHSFRPPLISLLFGF